MSIVSFASGYSVSGTSTLLRSRPQVKQQVGEADHIVIVDTSTGDLVDISEHLGIDRFEQGTKILALGELRETPLFEVILNELFQEHQSDLEYQELSNDDQTIREHVRSRSKAFEAEVDTFEWAEQVECLVDEIVKIRS